MLKKLILFLLRRGDYPSDPEYWTGSIYGFGKWIRVYGFFPSFLKMYIYTDHGPGDGQNAPHEIDSPSSIQFYHSPNLVERWECESNKPCFTLYSPFVFARRKLGISYNKKSSGTIFFLAHGTQSVTDKNEVAVYDQELARIPVIYQPITICMHANDIKSGLDKKYHALGYEIVTAGEPMDQSFIENFYQILSNTKYVLSNHFGSHALYAIEMGVPFGLYGTHPDYWNDGSDKNIESGEYVSFQRSDYYQKAMEYFNGLPLAPPKNDAIDFVRYHLGITKGISRFHMSIILYSTFLTHHVKKLIFALIGQCKE